MKKIIISLLIALPLISNAQKVKSPSVPIADETWITDTTKTTCKVTTCSDEVYLRLMRDYQGLVKKVVMYPNKKDVPNNQGKVNTYTEYVVYFPKKMFTELSTFLTSL